MINWTASNLMTSRIHHRHYRFFSFSLLVFLTLMTACAPQRKPVPPGVIPDPIEPTIEEEQYGHKVLSGLSEQYQLDYQDPRLDSIVKIVDRLAAQAGSGNHPWHVYLFKADDVKNAAATRGNHVFVWSGMLDATKSEDELAGVLAHEIAHVLARHTDPDPNEQVRQLLIGVGSIAASIAVANSIGNPTAAQNVGRLAGSLTQEVGKGLLVNPYGRRLELEADRIGLQLMYEAGYDPKALVAFWERAANDPAFSSSLQFFSTHPPADERLSALKKLLPELSHTERSRTANQLGAVSRQSPTTTKNSVRNFGSTSKSDASVRLYKVSEPEIIVYSSPSLLSSVKRRLERGEELKASYHGQTWLKVSSPIDGYVLDKVVELSE